MRPPVLGAPHQDRYLGRAADHPAIDADIVNVGLRILGDAAGVGEDIASAVEPVPFRNGKPEEIDVVSGNHVLLYRTVLHDARRNPVLEYGSAYPDKFAHRRVLRQAEHHRDPGIAGLAAGEYPRAQGVRRVVIPDIAEQERGSVAASLDHPDEVADLDIPVDLAGDFLKLVRFAERIYPSAKVAEDRRSAVEY